MRILSLPLLVLLLVAAAVGDSAGKECHDGTCITEHEWSQLDWSWQILRDISLKVDGNNASVEDRTKLWESFTDFTINSKGSDPLTDVTPSSQEEFPLDVIALFVQAFHGNRNHVRERDKPIKEIVENREHDGMRYDKQIILVLEPDDPIVSEAANDLYHKHESKSAVVIWDERLGRFRSVKGGFPKLTKYDRVQVVGHGREMDGKTKIGGRTGAELADEVAKLPGAGDGEIGRISLIGCNIAKTAKPDSMPLGDEPFLTEFMNDLKSKHGIETVVSARNTFVQVNAEGRKMVAEVTPDGMKWHSKDASKKVVLSFDEDGNIVSEKVPATERIPAYPCVDCALGPLDVATVDGVSEIYLLVGPKGKERIATIDHNEMNRVLDKQTVNTFLKSKDDLIREAMIQNKDKVAQRFKLKRSDDVKTVGYNIVSIDGNSVTIEGVGKKGKRNRIELNIGSSVKNAYVYEWGNKLEVRGRKVRVISSVEEMVREINWLGLNGIRNKGKDNLYRFGDWVISLGKGDFYANIHGFIASEQEAGDNEIDKVITDRGKAEKKWPFNSEKGRPMKPPSNIDKVSYDQLQDNIDDWGTLKECMDHWYKGDHSAIASSMKLGYGSAKAAVLTFAFSISESVRNFRTHIVNVMALEMLDPLRHGATLTMKEFLQNHPMARGGTWPDRGRTGFNGLNEGNTDKVLPRELAFTRHWLLSLKPDEANPHGRVTAIDKSDPRFRGQPVENTELEEIIDSFAIRDFNAIAKGEDGLGRRTTGQSESQGKEEKRGPLGDMSEIVDTAEVMESRRTSLDIRSLSLRSMSAVAADHAYLTGKVAEIVRSKSLPANFKLDENSVKVEEDEMKFSMVNEENPAEKEELSGEIDHSELQTHDTVDDLHDHVTEFADPVKGGVHQANTVLGVYGIVSGLGGALQAFEDGKSGEGFSDLLQSSYGIGDLTGLNKKISKAAGKAFVSLFKDKVVDLKTAIGDKLGSQVEEGLGKTAGEVGDLMEDVPILRLAFGIMSVVDDIKQHNALGYIDAGLDTAIAGLSMLSPEAEPVVLALTVVRMFIGDFYNEIDSALKKLPKDAGSLQKFDAFMKGFALALKDVWEQVTLFGQIFGAIEHSRNLDKEYNKNRAFLRGLADYHNYFKVENVKGGSVVNFADGSSSWNGGDITFWLHEDGTATLKMDENVDENGNQRTVTHTINVGDSTGIVAGIGESHDISFKTETVKIFFFIPVDKKRIISGIDGDRNSLHGTYYGNSKDNQFFTVQKLPDNSKLDYTLGDYFTTCTEWTATTSSTLVLRSQMFMGVTNWFSGDRYRHLNFLADKGVFFEVRAAAFGIPRLVAIAIDCSKDKSARTVDTSQPPWKNVVTVHGSNYSDTIVGNDQDNRLDGGNGTDHLTGGKGKDMYIVDAYDTGNDVINNCADDTQTDTLMVGFEFLSTIGRIDNLNLELLTDKKSGHFIRVLNWYRGPDCQHLTFVSTDGVAYKASTNTSLEDVPLTAYLIDKESKSSGQTVDTASIPKFSTVVSVIGSNYTDKIIGNKRDNYISGGPGDDVIRGGEGADTYVMRPGHGYDTIINLAFDRKLDTLLFGFNFSDVSLAREECDLIVKSNGSTKAANLKDWFKGEFHQHLVIRTIDDVVSVLPKSQNDSLVLTPTVIDKSKSKTDVQINCNIKPWRSIQRLIGGNHSDILTGNDEINYLDPKIGGSKLMGGNNSDTYIIKVGYGTDNVIDNFAADNKTDVLSFEAHYSDMRLVDGGSDDLLLSSVNHTALTLSHFQKGQEYQHLFIQSGDGVGFTLSQKNDSESFQAIPLLINRATSLNHEKIDLRSSWNWTEVNSVIGSSTAANYIQGQGKDNTLVGGTKVDSLKGDAGNDLLRGGDGENFLDGGLGNDTLVGGKDVDWMLGWLGDDLLYGGYGADRIDGGPGCDTVLFSGNPVNRTGIYVDLHYGQGAGADAEGDIYISVENVYGTPYDDVLIGNDDDNIILGRAGNDVIYPGNGTDLLIGAEGRDVYIIGGTTGVKTIQNAANDSAEDTLTLLPIRREHIKIDRYGDHLSVSIGDRYSGYWCPEGELGPIIIQNWFSNDTNMHLVILCNDTKLNQTDLDDMAVPYAKPSSMNNFVCSVYDFGVGKAVAIGLVCFVILLALIVIIMLAYTGRLTKFGRKTSDDKEGQSFMYSDSVNYNSLRDADEQLNV
ncbi:uncharacterized protein LOC135496637 [Lineus longissimus]|uniref:uncharacterized protein LOC135496637 n=1 Tax=Lineus longissimus TaxID=88925 RepID=UPI00315CE25C